jgi:hypothetical protein
MPAGAAREDARPPKDDIETVERILLEGERPREPHGLRVKSEDATRRNAVS